MFCIIWRNPVTKEASYMKGEEKAFYWEPGFDSDVLTWPTNVTAGRFANRRVNVPYEIEETP